MHKINLLNEEIDKLQLILPIGDEVFDEDKTGKIKQIQYLHKKSLIFKKLLDDIAVIPELLIGHNNYTILNMQLPQPTNQKTKKDTKIIQ